MGTSLLALAKSIYYLHRLTGSPSFLQAAAASGSLCFLLHVLLDPLFIRHPCTPQMAR